MTKQTTAKELIAFLQQYPDDAIIEVLKEDSRGYATTTSWVDLDLNISYGCSDNVDVLDFREDTVDYLKRKLSETSPHVFGKVFIRFGEK